jgi:hypothetical protein
MECKADTYGHISVLGGKEITGHRNPSKSSCESEILSSLSVSLLSLFDKTRSRTLLYLNSHLLLK